MKTRWTLYCMSGWFCAQLAAAQPATTPAGGENAAANDIATVDESQKQALDQAKELFSRSQDPTERSRLQLAMENMEKADKALQAAQKNPADLSAAIEAEQAAYQAVLQLTPREFRVTRNRKKSKGGNSSGQPNQKQMDQLELTSEENRYETEKQASAPQTPAQKEQLETANRLKELAQRQQDLNDRLRELQTALQQARDEKEKEEIKRELKHLADEEKQMLNDLDELHQKLDQAQDSSALSQTAKGLDQARSETEKAAQDLANESVSQALASGSRAQQSMQNLREGLRGQTSSQFTQQMRQLQNQARDLSQEEEKIGQTLQNMQGPDHQTLDDEKQRQDLVKRMSQQESALTNLLSTMQDLTERAESTEPLLSEQLYDTLRHSGPMHIDSALDTTRQLVDRGFLDKAAQVENSARTNINDLSQRIERAAESVLGSQADALRYAQSELDKLTKEVGQGLGGETNLSGSEASGGGPSTNSLATRTNAVPGAGRTGQTNLAGAANAKENANSRNGQPGETAARNGSQSRQGKDGQRQPGQSGQGQQGQDGQPQSGEGQSENANTEGNAEGGQGGKDTLSKLVQQSRAGNRNANAGGGANGVDARGPITGGDFANWADRMRDVEQVVDSTELRNRLATLRERVAAYRADYRLHDRKPTFSAVKENVVQPMIQARAEIQEALARIENSHSLVPLDHDPVPDNYAELVRKYYEKLGGGQ